MFSCKTTTVPTLTIWSVDFWKPFYISVILSFIFFQAQTANTVAHLEFLLFCYSPYSLVGKEAQKKEWWCKSKSKLHILLGQLSLFWDNVKTMKPRKKTSYAVISERRICCGSSSAIKIPWQYTLTYEWAVSSCLQSYILSRFQLCFVHLRLWKPEGPGATRLVLFSYFHQLCFVHYRWQLLLRQTVWLPFSLNLCKDRRCSWWKWGVS